MSFHIGSERLRLSSNLFHVNSSGVSMDTRVDTLNSQNILFVRGGTDNIGMGTATPNTSALLDITSTTRGFLPPRMTTAQVTAVATPADGLIVYDTDTDTIKLRANGAWVSLTSGTFSESYLEVGAVTNDPLVPWRWLCNPM